jgi:NAD(P)-dependent dehydrogenase (short-subunit alcohol dehydrogenase family)
LRFADGRSTVDGPIAYRASVASFDDRFNLLKVAAQLARGDVPLCEAELRAFVREDLPAGGRSELARRLPDSRALEGRVALVTGGSRGLGARIVQALASQGCTVFANFLRSRTEMERIAAEVADAPGVVVPIQGDVGDPRSCQQIRQRIVSEYGGLDVLVCNAALPLQPMALHANFATRLAKYVSQSVALASTPIATLSDLTSQRCGWTVIISSAAVASPPAEWPHYVSAKTAIEALAHVAALQHPRVSYLVVRPPKLLTDLTNVPAPVSRLGALGPEVVAARLTERLLGPPTPGRVELLTNFA